MKSRQRRDFLKSAGILATQTGIASLSLGGGSLLAGCASLDRMILGEGQEDPNRVFILGGGLAGLTSAYLLKKSGLPFYVFEGSRRVGGRVYSLSDFNSAAQVGELGGEWIWPGQDNIIQLAKELQLELAERKLEPGKIFYSADAGDRNALVREFGRFEQEMQKQKNERFGRAYLRLTQTNAGELPRAVELDDQNASELLSTFKSTSGEVKTIVTRLLENHYGVSAKNLSALQVLYFITQVQSPLHPLAHRGWRLNLGSSALVQALYDRVAGVIPGRAVKLSHQLIEVDRQDKLFELKFQTPEGVKTFLASKVISTLPMHLISQVRGFYKLGLEENVVKTVASFQAGSLSKAALSFSERPWIKAQSSDRGFLGKETQFWETEPRSSTTVSLTPKAVLSLQWGGDVAERAGPHTVEEAVKEITAARMQTGYEQKFQIQNWHQVPLVAGGSSIPKLGGNKWLGGLLSSSDSAWVMAGDYSSVVWMGTMNGAIESAQAAVQKIKALPKTKS